MDDITTQNVNQIDEDFNVDDTVALLLGVPTYLSLMRKYPEARQDLLNLRRSKNQALIGVVAIASAISFLIGYSIFQVI